MQKNLKHISSPYFVFSLAVLVLNDFYLKDQYHNFITGKLSDFFGLFVFSVFWTALFPTKKVYLFFLTAILFIYWKSPFSQSFIDIWSRYLFTVNRTIDFTDLYALLALPVAWRYLSKTQVLFINPYLAAIFTLFSFCATSLPHYEQQFEQPQYVLFNAASPDADTTKYEGLKVSRIGHFELVQVLSIPIKNEPVKWDDFQKKIVLQDLDSSVLYIMGKLLSKPKGLNSLIIPFKGYTDIAIFKNSRLDGKFERKAENGKTLINGYYRNGLEDSVWAFRDSVGEGMVMKTYKNGEPVKIDSLYNGKLISSSTVNTRADSIRNKYFQVAFLLLSALGAIALLLKNFKSGYTEVFQMSLTAKLILTATLPILSIAISTCISALIPDAYKIDFFSAFLVFFFAYLILIVFFTISIFAIGIRKRIDLFWYMLLFALAGTAIMEIMQISRLAD